MSDIKLLSSITVRTYDIVRLTLIIFFLTTILNFAMGQQQDFFSWSQFTPIPDSVGCAGSYAGVSHDALIVAGGANFPDGIGPWGNTKKTWYDHVFVLENPTGQWKRAG